MAAPLPIGKILMGAFLVPWWNRKAFARALAIPLMLMVAYSISWYYAYEQLPLFARWLAYMIYVAFFVLFAVTCHRLVLLDPIAVARRAEPRWTWRESRFFAWVLVFWALYMIVTLSFVMTIGTVVVNIVREGDFFRWVEYAAKVGAYYVFARICPVFPATAVDRKANLRWAWHQTRGNGWRLFVVVGVLPWLLTFLFDAVYEFRDNPTPPEILLLSIAGTALFTFEVAALSMAYRELTKEV